MTLRLTLFINRFNEQRTFYQKQLADAETTATFATINTSAIAATTDSATGHAHVRPTTPETFDSAFFLNQTNDGYDETVCDTRKTLNGVLESVDCQPKLLSILRDRRDLTKVFDDSLANISSSNGCYEMNETQQSDEDFTKSGSDSDASAVSGKRVCAEDIVVEREHYEEQGVLRCASSGNLKKSRGSDSENDK